METDPNVLELEIITHTESKKIPVFWIEIESPTGNFIVGPDHAPLVSKLKERGKLTYKVYQSGVEESEVKETSINTYGGIFKIDGNKATAILDFTD